MGMYASVLKELPNPVDLSRIAEILTGVLISFTGGDEKIPKRADFPEPEILLMSITLVTMYAFVLIRVSVSDGI